MIGSVSMPALDQLFAMLAKYLELDDTDCLSLPPAAYLSSEFFNLEIENIFKKSWLCVGHVEYDSQSRGLLHN
jgi:hypothetical protein